MITRTFPVIIEVMLVCQIINCVTSQVMPSDQHGAIHRWVLICSRQYILSAISQPGAIGFKNCIISSDKLQPGDIEFKTL